MSGIRDKYSCTLKWAIFCTSFLGSTPFFSLWNMRDYSWFIISFWQIWLPNSLYIMLKNHEIYSHFSAIFDSNLANIKFCLPFQPWAIWPYFSFILVIQCGINADLGIEKQSTVQLIGVTHGDWLLLCEKEDGLSLLYKNSYVFPPSQLLSAEQNKLSSSTVKSAWGHNCLIVKCLELLAFHYMCIATTVWSV